jgi:hypothetical protein
MGEKARAMQRSDAALVRMGGCAVAGMLVGVLLQTALQLAQSQLTAAVWSPFGLVVGLVVGLGAGAGSLLGARGHEPRTGTPLRLVLAVPLIGLVCGLAGGWLFTWTLSIERAAREAPTDPVVPLIVLLALATGGVALLLGWFHAAALRYGWSARAALVALLGACAGAAAGLGFAAAYVLAFTLNRVPFCPRHAYCIEPDPALVLRGWMPTLAIYGLALGVIAAAALGVTALLARRTVPAH